jgi:ribosomal protein S18 acetylase RimI-like enzyme
MPLSFRPYEPDDHARVLEICIAAFTPVHEGFEVALGPEIFERHYAGWRERYAVDLEQLAKAPNTMIHVVEDGGAIVGFVTTIVDPEKRLGEIGLNAVAPAMQGRRIGRSMYDFALGSLKARGADMAYVGTGADAAHAPARAAYEAVGFDRSIPTVHLFRKL